MLKIKDDPEVRRVMPILYDYFPDVIWRTVELEKKWWMVVAEKAQCPARHVHQAFQLLRDEGCVERVDKKQHGPQVQWRKVRPPGAEHLPDKREGPRCMAKHPDQVDSWGKTIYCWRPRGHGGCHKGSGQTWAAVPLHKCASPNCPGYPWKASNRAHPFSTCGTHITDPGYQAVADLFIETCQVMAVWPGEETPPRIPLLDEIQAWQPTPRIRVHEWLKKILAGVKDLPPWYEVMELPELEEDQNLKKASAFHEAMVAAEEGGTRVRTKDELEAHLDSLKGKDPSALKPGPGSDTSVTGTTAQNLVKGRPLAEVFKDDDDLPEISFDDLTLPDDLASKESLDGLFFHLQEHILNHSQIQWKVRRSDWGELGVPVYEAHGDWEGSEDIPPYHGVTEFILIRDYQEAEKERKELALRLGALRRWIMGELLTDVEVARIDQDILMKLGDWKRSVSQMGEVYLISATFQTGEKGVLGVRFSQAQAEEWVQAMERKNENLGEESAAELLGMSHLEVRKYRTG